MTNPMKHEDITDAFKFGPDFTYEFDSDDPELDEDFDDDDDALSAPIICGSRNPPKSIQILSENEYDIRRNHSNALTSPVQLESPGKIHRRKIQSKSSSIDSENAAPLITLVTATSGTDNQNSNNAKTEIQTTKSNNAAPQKKANTPTSNKQFKINPTFNKSN